MDGFASDGSANVAHLRFGGFLLSAGVVVFRPRYDAGLHQFLGAAEVDACQIALRLETRELRPFLAGIEFHQDISLVYPLARLKMNFIDCARQVRAHGYS